MRPPFGKPLPRRGALSLDFPYRRVALHFTHEMKAPLFRSALVIVMVGVIALAPLTALAAATKAKKPREFDKVVAVDTVGNEITIFEKSHKTDATFKLTPFTKIIVNGKPAKLADVKRGMKVDVTSTGAKTASRIEAEDPPLPK